MTSSAPTGVRRSRAARFLEASERMFDPETIESKLSALQPNQQSLLLKLYRSSGSRLTVNEMRQRAELIRLFKATADDIESDIFRVFSSLGKESWDYNQVRRIGRDKQLLDQITNRIRALGSAVKGSFDDALLDQFKKTWADSAYRLDSLTPDSITIKTGLLPDSEIVSMLNEPWNGARFSDRLGLITDDMAQKIKSELIRSMMAEESWQDSARRIRSEMGTRGQKSVWRAEMVARTEIAHAQTMANTQLHDANADVIENVIWVASPQSCLKICKPKHGQTVEEVGYPPDDSHPNCTCATLAVPKTWGKLAQAGDGDFSVTPESRKSWAEANDLADVV